MEYRIIMEKIIDSFSEKAKHYIKSISSREVFPSQEHIVNLKAFDILLQDNPAEPLEVLDMLDIYGSPATITSSGNRYFGFVIGGALPAPLSANLLASVWDQNAGMEVSSPVSSFIESVCRKWLVDILNLPEETEVGFVTGATMANFTGLAAARHALLKGAFDPIDEICETACSENTWIHVDGAFGLWAAVSPMYRYLVKGIEKADSWATDEHK